MIRFFVRCPGFPSFVEHFDFDTIEDANAAARNVERTFGLKTFVEACEPDDAPEVHFAAAVPSLGVAP